MTMPDFRYYVHVVASEGYEEKWPDEYWCIIIPERHYWQMLSIGAFRQKHNWTSERLLYIMSQHDVDLDLKFKRRAGLHYPPKEEFKTFPNLWEFYKFIGYDYKKKKYTTGETLKKVKRRKVVS